MPEHNRNQRCADNAELLNALPSLSIERQHPGSPGREPHRALMVVIDASVLVDALQARATANRLGLRRHPSRSLWPRAWELRTNLSATTP